jgi:hypothetical protein
MKPFVDLFFMADLYFRVANALLYTSATRCARQMTMPLRPARVSTRSAGATDGMVNPMPPSAMVVYYWVYRYKAVFHLILWWNMVDMYGFVWTCCENLQIHWLIIIFTFQYGHVMRIQVYIPHFQTDVNLHHIMHVYIYTAKDPNVFWVLYIRGPERERIAPC